MMLNSLTKGINNVPSILTNLFDSKFNIPSALNVVTILGSSINSYENQILAGRLLLYVSTRTCKSVEIYLTAYKHRLNSKTYNFLQKHASILNEVLANNITREYTQCDFFSADCIIKQYLLKTSYDEEPLENIQMMHLRQAVQLYSDYGIDRVLKSYEELSNQLFTHASPTIFNAGTTMNQLASCFLLSVGDNMNTISNAVGIISNCSKMNGGIGINVTELRHSEIGFVGMSEGPCGFLSIYDTTIGKVNQGGKRNGAGTAFLASWHYDFAKFVKMTDNFGDPKERLKSLNTCAWMNDLLYVRIANAIKANKDKSKGIKPDPNLKTDWTMFCPKKAEKLLNLYGVEFIRVYEDMELLATFRESQYKNCVAEVKRLHSELLSNPESKEIREAYFEARIKKGEASKSRIEHIVINAYQLYLSIINIQINSGMPYMMNADACQKNNQKNIGVINQSNLCLEILEVSKSETKDSKASISSCNLGSMNLPLYVKGTINWEKQIIVNTPTDYINDIIDAFDFDKYGQSVGSLTENLNSVIDMNYYPLDTVDESGNIVNGEISTTNYLTRPIGVGVSGQSDVLSLMDCPYDGPVHIMFNKMSYACMYWNSLVTSLALAVRDGEYSTFRTGSFKYFTENKEMIELKGSPLSNGLFQFDLWQEEARILKENKLLDEKVYDITEDKPLEPSVWGQKTLYLYVIPNTNSEIEITSIQRVVVENEVELIVTPSWEVLKNLIMLHGVRNSLLIALMPTASSANILRNCESTEAHQSMIYAKDLKFGNYTILVRHLVNDLTSMGLWSEKLANFIAACEGSIKHIKHYIIDHYTEFDSKCFIVNTEYNNVTMFTDLADTRLDFIISKYKTMYEISMKFVLNLARSRGIYICQSQSTNIYIKDPTIAQMEALHVYANKLRLKTGMYYLRQSPAKSTGNFTLPVQLLEYTNRLSSKIGRTLSSPKPKVVEVIEKQCTMEADCIECSA